MRGYSGVGSLLAIGLAVASLEACAVAPPVQQMSDARQAIAAAENAAADRFARDEISEARGLVAEAEADIAAEAFASARAKALRAQTRAMRALRIALAAESADADP